MLLESKTAERSAQQENEYLLATRTFRYTARLRSGYARLRRLLG
jgi:hypothetical protein